MASTVEKLHREQEKLMCRLKIIPALLLKAIRHSFIECKYCNKKSKMSSWVFAQAMHYISPYECGLRSGCWEKSEIDACDIICPKCNIRNYLFNHSQRDKVLYLTRNFSFSENELFDEVIVKHCS